MDKKQLKLIELKPFLVVIIAVFGGTVLAFAGTYIEQYETHPPTSDYAAILASPNGLTYDTYDARAFRRLEPYPVWVLGSGDENFYWGYNAILPAPLYGEPGSSYCDDNATNYLFNGYGTGYYVASPDMENDFILGINFTNGPTNVYGASIGYASGSNAPTHNVTIYGYNGGEEVWSVGTSVGYGSLSNITIPETNDPVDRIEVVRSNNITDLFGHLPVGWYTFDNLEYEISGDSTGGYQWKYYDQSEYELGNFFDEETLPVVLSSFTVSYVDDEMILCWETQSEVDNLGWNIYRNSEQDFTAAQCLTAELIDGYGTTSSPSCYTYQDRDSFIVDQTYYYWLESIDYSGIHNVYTRIAQITVPDPSEIPGQIEPPIVYGLRNIPNPSFGDLKFQFTIDVSGVATISVYNLKGELVITLPSVWVDSDVTRQIQWNGKDQNGVELNPGIYIYKLSLNNCTLETKKLIIVK